LLLSVVIASAKVEMYKGKQGTWTFKKCSLMDYHDIINSGIIRWRLYVTSYTNALELSEKMDIIEILDSPNDSAGVLSMRVSIPFAIDVKGGE